MQIINHYADCPKDAKGSVVALGNFDGLHRGHQEILRLVKSEALDENSPSSVLTFEPHPRSVFKPDQAPFRITSIDDKARILESMGIDYLFCQKFDEAFSQMSATDFIDEILIKNLKVKAIITGNDFVFGHNREGNVEFLKKKSKDADILHFTLDPVKSDGLTYSSTQIREFLRTGMVEKANSFLGHAFQVTGVIQEGAKRGRTIGFPTANIDLGDYLRPKFGVYKVRISVAGEVPDLPAIANIGNKPTFGENKDLLEVHIFDFKKDLYGKKAVVKFDEFIREERKFDSKEDLVKQIEEDCTRVK